MSTAERIRRMLLKVGVVTAGLIWASALLAQGVFPFCPGSGQLRIVTWNIENLGSRTPRRSDAQLQDLAERLLTFEAPIIALQEISSSAGGNRPALQTVLDHMGPEWMIVIGEFGNGVVYNSLLVSFISGQELVQLQQQPYSTFYEDFPDWRNQFGSNGDPFSNGRSLPYSAVFSHHESSSMIRVISNHFHFGQDLAVIREYEGNAVRHYVEELLADPLESPRIAVVGDFNAAPEGSPHPQLTSGGQLQIVEKENSQNTGVMSSGNANIDHMYMSSPAFQSTVGQSSFVILPEHYAESPEEFEATYSDHSPVLVDLEFSSGFGFSGSWYDPSHDGEGWMIQVLDDNRALINWYSYNSDGAQMWMTGVGTISGDTIHVEEMLITNGGIFGPQFNPDDVELTIWGSLTITFVDCDNATVEYVSVTGLGSGVLNPIRLTEVAGLECD